MGRLQTGFTVDVMPRTPVWSCLNIFCEGQEVQMSLRVWV